MRHIVDVYKAWQPKFASYELNNFEEEQALEQAILEMVAEAGEVLELMQKARRKQQPIDRELLRDELSDVLWGLTGIMNRTKTSWSELCEHNIKKLEARFEAKGVGR